MLHILDPPWGASEGVQTCSDPVCTLTCDPWPSPSTPTLLAEICFSDLPAKNAKGNLPYSPSLERKEGGRFCLTKGSCGPPKANPAEVLDWGEAEVQGAGSGGLEQQVWAGQVRTLCLELVWLPWGGEEWSPCPLLLY